MKKIQEPKLKVIKFENRDVIATSTPVEVKNRKITCDGFNYVGNSWY